MRVILAVRSLRCEVAAFSRSLFVLVKFVTLTQAENDIDDLLNGKFANPQK